MNRAGEVVVISATGERIPKSAFLNFPFNFEEYMGTIRRVKRAWRIATPS